MPPRLAVIDAVRGFCLVNIFVNHLQLGYLTLLSPSRMGFSDSSDLFVLLSGLSTALSFAGRSTASAPVVVPLWSRALRLYAFDLAIVAATIVLFAAILALRGPVGVNAPALALLSAHGPWTLFWHGATLRQTVGYSDVLRLYVALMLVAPVLLRLAFRAWWAPLPLAVLLWLSGGHFGLVAANSLSGAPHTLTVLPWTLLFAIGIALGRRIGSGLPVRGNRLALTLAVSYLLGYLLLSLILAWIWPAALDWVQAHRNDFWLGASKAYQSPLRVLHAVSLVYVVLALPDAPVIRLLHRATPGHVLTRLGRNSLVVFSLGAVLAVAGAEVLDLARGAGMLPLLALEVSLVGLYVSLALWLTDARRRARSAGPARASPSLP